MVWSVIWPRGRRRSESRRPFPYPLVHLVTDVVTLDDFQLALEMIWCSAPPSTVVMDQQRLCALAAQQTFGTVRVLPVPGRSEHQHLAGNVISSVLYASDNISARMLGRAEELFHRFEHGITHKTVSATTNQECRLRVVSPTISLAAARIARITSLACIALFGHLCRRSANARANCWYAPSSPARISRARCMESWRSL